MDTIVIAKTARTPEIVFDFSAGTFLIKGEAYPEDVTDFFGPLLDKFKNHFKTLAKQTISFRIELIYFNSSTAKMLMQLFQLLDELGKRGNSVSITWAYEAEDDNLKELGEEFSEEISHAKFTLEELPV
jgi:hypothetical protein